MATAVTQLPFPPSSQDREGFARWIYLAYTIISNTVQLTTLTLPVSIANGGTGATTLAAAQTALQISPSTTVLKIANNLSDVNNKTTSFNNVSPITTKGDLITSDGTNNVRNSVGTDTYSLVADSTQTNGLNWKRRCYLASTLTNATGNSGAGVTTLFNYAVPGNTLSANGDSLRLTIWGTFAANANNKTITIAFGATTITTVGPTALNSGSFYYTTLITRTGATAQAGMTTGYLNSSTTATRLDVASPAETLSSSINLTVTGQGTANNDLVLTTALVELLPT